MVTGCGCHDPIVFGHQRPCQLGLGPIRTGGLPQREQRTYVEYQAIYGPAGNPEIVAARQLPPLPSHRQRAEIALARLRERLSQGG